MFVDFTSDGKRLLKRLHEAFLKVFHSQDVLDPFMGMTLGRNRQSITTKSGLRAQIFEIIQKAAAEGWLVEFTEAAKEKFKGNVRFVRVCDEYLKAPDAIEPGNENPETLVDIRSEIRENFGDKWFPRNFALLVVLMLCGTVWLTCLLGSRTILWALGGIGVWLSTTLVQAKLESRFLREVDDALLRFFKKMIGFYVLGGLIVVLLIVSLFVGTLHVYGNQMESFTVNENGVSRNLRMRDGNSNQFFITTPWKRRQLSVGAKCREPKIVSIIPWQRQHISVTDLKAVPQVLLLPASELLAQIPSTPWKLEIRVKGKEDHASVELSWNSTALCLGTRCDDDRWNKFYTSATGRDPAKAKWVKFKTPLKSNDDVEITIMRNITGGKIQRSSPPLRLHVKSGEQKYDIPSPESWSTLSQ